MGGGVRRLEGSGCSSSAGGGVLEGGGLMLGEERMFGGGGGGQEGGGGGGGGDTGNEGPSPCAQDAVEAGSSLLDDLFAM